MLYLTTHSTHFIYGYMASNIWLRTILIVRKENRCRHIGYSFRLTARVRTDRIAHTTDFVTPVVEHWLEHMYNEDKQAISLCQGMTLTFYFFIMNSTYHGLCYTSRGALAGTRNSSLKHESGDKLELCANLTCVSRKSMCLYSEVYDVDRIPTDFMRAPRSISLSTFMFSKHAKPNAWSFLK